MVATVSSALVENTLRTERGLIESLREVFARPRLALHIEVQKPVPTELPKAAKPLSNSDKLLKLFEKNPLVKELSQRFALRFDDH